MWTVRKYLLVDIFSYESSKRITNVDEEITVHVSTSLHPSKTRLVYGRKVNSVQVGIVTCHDYQTFEWILTTANQLPEQTWILLQNGFIQKNIKKIHLVLNAQQYISRSITINMNWCQRLWSLEARAHLIAFTGVYYSVLGGAFCSLGKNNSRYAYKAGALAIQQIKLARILKDTILECKCWLYYAEDLIQLGKLKRANKIIIQQTAFIKQNDDSTLWSMLEAVIGKMSIGKNRLTIPQ